VVQLSKVGRKLLRASRGCAFAQHITRIDYSARAPA